VVCLVPRAPGADHRRRPGRGGKPRADPDIDQPADGQKIAVSLFIDPDADQSNALMRLARSVELHTGRFADAPEGPARDKEFAALEKASELF